MLDDEISREKIFNVLHKVDRKSPGLNGFPFEFSKMMRDVAVDDLLNMVREVLIFGRMGDF